MVGAFTYVMPLSSCWMARNATFTSRVYTDEESP
jgi:hypothetical protein